METRADVPTLVGATLGPYRLTEWLADATHGPIYLAQHTANQTTFLVSVLALPAQITPDARNAFLARFADVTAPLAALQHPYILPVVDAGHARGLPYVVYPATSTRPLSARLTQSGPVDALTAGRYLDQLAGALEYAHEHDILHGALSAACVFIQRNGNLTIADFGVRQLLITAGPFAPEDLAARGDDALAPEELRWQPGNETTDVYALSAVIYRLLTGHGVFEGTPFQAIAQQTLRAPVPSLQQWRADLPPELDPLFAQALAKDPEQRFRRPGVFANAYHQVVAPFNASRVPFVDATPQRRAVSRSLAARQRPSPSADVASPPPPPPLGAMGIPYPPPRRKVEFGRIFASVILIALIALSGIFVIQNHFAAPPKASGVVHFFDATGQAGHVNALNVTASNLPKPASGAQYHVWLIDTTNEAILSLGTLQPQGKTYTLSFTSTDQHAATNLLGAGDLIEITEEHGPTQAPTGKTILRGAYPAQVFTHIRHLLVSFPATPGQIGLLTGMLDQVTLIHTEAQQLQTAVNSHVTATTRCLAISMLDILEGAQGAHYQAAPAGCPAGISRGDGYGVLPPRQNSAEPYGSSQASGGYLAGAEDHATLAATQPDATAAIQTRARQVAATLNSLEAPAQQLDTDLVTLANAPDAAPNLPDILTLVNRLYAGGANASAPQGGVLTAYAQGLAVADLPLVGVDN